MRGEGIGGVVRRSTQRVPADHPFEGEFTPSSSYSIGRTEEAGFAVKWRIVVNECEMVNDFDWFYEPMPVRITGWLVHASSERKHRRWR